MNIYIDESGSMTHENSQLKNRYFIICMIFVKGPKVLKKVFERFISKNLSKLKEIDNNNNKMFNGDKFIELKGAALTKTFKKLFVEYFCQKDHFKILYILVDNQKATDNFYKNKARAFNYLLKISLEYLCNKNILTDRDWMLQIDERNVKTESKYLLREFLLTECSTGSNKVDEVCVEYFNSCSNKLIQLADVFANILYSNIVTNGCYEEQIKFMKDNGYIIDIFKFPL